MLNKFRNVIYGASNSNDDARLDYDNREPSTRRARSALTRSSSFREDLLDNLIKGIENGENKSMPRGKSQVFHRLTNKNSNGNQYSVNNLIDDARYRQINEKPKFRYSRPEFLQLKTEDEISVSADHQIRPIILPRDISRLPWKSGYAECINAGKSLRNEDQAACHKDSLIKDWTKLYENNLDLESVSIEDKLPWVYFGIFDGHAGTAVAVAAAKQLQSIVGEKLGEVAELLINLEFDYNDDDNNEQLFEGETNERKSQGDLTNIKAQNHSGLESITQTNGSVSDNDQSKTVTSESETCNIDSNPIARASTRDPERHGTNAECTRTLPKNSDKSSGVSPNKHLYDMNDIVKKKVSVDSLVIGALEAAFWEMDEQIASDKQYYKMAGGCTAIVGLFILGKLYVCNAGDSRAIVYKNNQVVPMSFDFTPTSERDRILRLGLQRPELLGNEFTVLEFVKRPTLEDLGKSMLYKDAYMTGWSMKTITHNDLKYPLVWGEGKRGRVLATIGVTRGFGDHELRAHKGSVSIKPFLTPEPEVRVLPLEYDDSLSNEDVLIMGSDGLWDVTSNQEAADTVKASLALFPDNEESSSKYRYITAAQDLVIRSRGHTTNWNSVWRTEEDKLASLDDIAVFVIPLKQYRDEYVEWKKLRNEARLQTRRRRANEGSDASDLHQTEQLASVPPVAD